MPLPVIRALLARGEHDEAARRLREAGALREAADVLAQVWRHDEAVSLALASEHPEDAYKHAAASNDARLVERALAALEDKPDAARRAADHAELRGRTADAASLRRAAGDLEEAAALYERAGELGLAARIHERAGDLRRAGMLYERRLLEAPDDAASALALGRILLGFGRAEHAVRALQRAVQSADVEREALPWLLRALVAIGLLDAAGEILDRLRVHAPQLPLEPVAAAAALAAEDATPHTEASELLLGRYRVLRALGAGGSGRVLAAHDVFAARDVAVKVLSSGGGAQGRDALARFAREAGIAAGLEHPNVVRVFDYVPDGPLLVMELMPAGTLEDRLTKGERAVALSPLVAEHVARSVLRALDTVHRRGVVHRDLKPANVFFGAAGEVKVGDFGVAHLVDAQATLTGAMMGTLAFMAPEQITGASHPDATTDLYALGVMLYRMLVGALPFPGPDFVAQHLGDPVPAASANAPWLDPAFDRAIESLLAKDKAARPRSASDALELVESLPFAAAEDAFGALEARAPERPSTPPKGRASSRPPDARAADGTLSAGRYVPIELVRRGGLEARLCHDSVLGRRVLVLSADERVLERHARLAKAVSPFLQAVLAVDREAGEVVLEAPSGEPPRALPIDPLRLADMAEALDVLEAHGLSHGAIGADELVLGDARTVLLLPTADADGSIDEDRRAIERLFGGR
ncbi:MAG: protein kinase domain-containing protein [Deltaproteobacteria bacterium]